MKFKVGDEVIISGSSSYFLGNITRIDADAMTHPYYVQSDGYTIPYRYPESHLILATDLAKVLLLGDKDEV